MLIETAYTCLQLLVKTAIYYHYSHIEPTTTNRNSDKPLTKRHDWSSIIDNIMPIT